MALHMSLVLERQLVLFSLALLAAAADPAAAATAAAGLRHHRQHVTGS